MPFYLLLCLVSRVVDSSSLCSLSVVHVRLFCLLDGLCVCSSGSIVFSSSQLGILFVCMLWPCGVVGWLCVSCCVVGAIMCVFCLLRHVLVQACCLVVNLVFRCCSCVVFWCCVVVVWRGVLFYVVGVLCLWSALLVVLCVDHVCGAGLLLMSLFCALCRGVVSG